MNNTEIHLYILWQNARYKESEILEDMAKHFTILKRYAITWTPELVSSNFTRFYGVKLPSNSVKEQEYGCGEFVLCVVRDEHPVYGERETTAGLANVNINMFDAKSRYRDWTGGGHKIHATNSEEETNHDITLLLGKNVEDFLLDNSQPSNEVTMLKRDLDGATGWVSLEHLFYVLNNTVSYVILRGSMEPSCPPDLYCDTDAITPDYENFRIIVNGTPALSEIRPKSELHIQEKLYYLDVWDSRKNYYDPLWLESMLDTAVELDGMRVLNDENDFYCLLYHCLINKGYFDDKYAEKLQAYKTKFNIKEDDWAKVLVDWLNRHHYDIIEPKDDLSVKFNIVDSVINAYALRFGKCIRIVHTSTTDMRTGEAFGWTSKVFKKDNSYVKSGTPWLLDNEKRILSKVGDGICFPKILSSGGDNEEHWIEISAMPGKEMFANRWKIRMSNVRKYPLQLLDILKWLYEQDVLHRDIQLENILISKDGKMSIIDFGWAIDFRQDITYRCPGNMKMQNEDRNGYSDFYNVAMLFDTRWSEMPFVKRFAAELRKIDGEHYADRAFVEQQVALATMALHARFTLADYKEFILGKYKLRKYWGHPRRLYRRFKPTIEKSVALLKKLTSPGKVYRKIKRMIKKLMA